MIGRTIDRIVGAISPRAAVNRLAAREALEQIQQARASHLSQRTQFAAAKNTISTDGWVAVDSRINTIIANSLPTMRARGRQLLRDMPFMANGINRVVDSLVGDGLTLQSRIKDPSTGKLAKALNQRVEDEWNRFCDKADLSGRLHFNEMQRLSARQECGAEGEYILVKKRVKTGNGRRIPFALLCLPVEYLADYGTKPADGNEVFQGVEYSPATGEVQAYHFQDMGVSEFSSWRDPLRVSANQVITGFETIAVGQLRGVTPLAPVILLAHQLRDYLEAHIATAQKAARWLAFVTSKDPAATMAAFGAAASPTYVGNQGEKKYTMDMGHAVVDFLQAGDSVTVPNFNLPGDSFQPFVEFMLQTFAATLGVTYELVSGNYGNSKYTGARIARNDMETSIGVRRGRLSRQLCETVRREFMDWSVLTGRLNLPNYFSDPDPYLRALWVGPGAKLLDPLREGRAQGDAMANYTRSPQEILVGGGQDPETVLDEFQEWAEMLEERGLPLPLSMQKEANLASNPAKVAPGTGSGA